MNLHIIYIENTLNDFLDKFKELVIANSNLIVDANKEDLKHNKKQIRVKEFIEIIEKYRKKECILKDDERKIILAGSLINFYN